jgi:hypothetical protein
MLGMAKDGKTHIYKALVGVDANVRWKRNYR